MHPSVYILLLCSAAVRAEYKWTGTEWQWFEPEKDSASAILTEGSGDGGSPEDDEDYVDYYNGDYDDYKDDVYWSKNKDSNNNNNKFIDEVVIPNSNVPQVGFTDDEDLAEGSGLDVGIDSSRREPDLVTLDSEGSGSSFLDIEFPDKKNPPIDLDNPEWGIDSKDDTAYIGGSYPVQPPSNPTNIHEDYYNENLYPEGDNDDDFPPFDEDISIDDVRGGSASTPSSTKITSTTTTTTSTVRPFERDNRPKHSDEPTVSDVPTNRPVSFFAQPGILAAVIGGAVVGLLCAILLVMFIVYRMRKKDEGSYILDEPKRTHNGNLYTKTPNREFYA